MIDGIDEIEAALNGNFNMEGFIDSIDQLDAILRSCKVFLTSRNIGAERFRSLENADIFHLKGFETDDVKEYLETQPPLVAAKVERIVPKIKMKNGYVNPYLLSIAVEIFSDGDSEDELIGSTSKLDIDDPFQYILVRLLSREIEKQSLEIEIDDYYDLLDHLVVERENSMPASDFVDYIELMFRGKSSSVSLSSYLKCLLLRLENDRISVTHEQYASLISTKFGVNSLLSAKDASSYEISCMLKILGADHNDILGIKEAIVQSLWDAGSPNDKVNSKFKIFLDHFKKELISKSMMLPRAIYALHVMAFKFNRVKDSESAKVTLKELHGGNTIRNFYVLGDFQLIDLSDLIFEECEFNGYQRLLACKCGTNTKFKRSRFSNCHGKAGQGNLVEAMFDDCVLDEGMRLAVSHSMEKIEGRSARMRSDLKRVLKAMRVGLGFGSYSLNRIKQTVVLVTGGKLEVFLDQLCNVGLLSFEANSSLYNVRPSAQRDAIVLCEEGHVQGEIARILPSLVK